ncbi:hypothetical protein AB0F46_05565 [Streptomyces sp. NPDC026665]|uniref:hypothetical protein n=1 Tax=Streptomyces sp. NPDC026665 TaxID=3154798 RepID=UPI0033EBCA1A
MSTDRETNHDMAATDADIAFLLARAADEVEIGTAPYQAVVRGGRRRKVRRWAVTAAAALVVAGTTGTLALAGGTGGDDGGRRAVPAVTVPSTPEQRHVYDPQETSIGRGLVHGKEWSVKVVVWGAPRNEREAQYQRSRMSEYALTPTGTEVASDLVGKGWVFVRLSLEDQGTTTVVDGAVEKGDSLAGRDIESFSGPLNLGGGASAKTSQRLVIGKVAPTAKEVTCTWDDGTTIIAGKASPGTGIGQEMEDLIRPVDGSQPDWFTCVAPEGKHYASGTAKVTK